VLWDAAAQIGVLRRVGVWHMDMKDAAEFETHSKTITFPPDVGLPGGLQASGEERLIEVVQEGRATCSACLLREPRRASESAGT
jgi:hypothetical protein